MHRSTHEVANSMPEMKTTSKQHTQRAWVMHIAVYVDASVDRYRSIGNLSGFFATYQLHEYTSDLQYLTCSVLYSCFSIY